MPETSGDTGQSPEGTISRAGWSPFQSFGRRRSPHHHFFLAAILRAGVTRGTPCAASSYSSK